MTMASGMLNSKQARALLSKKAHLRNHMKSDASDHMMIPSLVKKPFSQQASDVLGSPSKLIGIRVHDFNHKKSLGGLVGPYTSRRVAESGLKVRTANPYQAKSSIALKDDIYLPASRRRNNFL